MSSKCPFLIRIGIQVAVDFEVIVQWARFQNFIYVTLNILIEPLHLKYTDST